MKKQRLVLENKIVLLKFEPETNPRSLMVLQLSKNWRKNLENTIELVSFLKNIYEVIKVPNHSIVNKISLFGIARKPVLKKFFIFLGWLPYKEGFLALCQNVENGCACEVLMRLVCAPTSDFSLLIPDVKSNANKCYSLHIFIVIFIVWIQNDCVNVENTVVENTKETRWM